MSRWVAPIALGALVAVAVIAVLLTVSRPQETAEGRSDALARELRCPDCQGLSVADSPTQSAAEIRRQIDEMLAAGASPDDVRAHFVARYGDWILLAPASPLVWAIPIVLVAVALTGLVGWLARGSRRAPRVARPRADAATRRVREEAEALDA